MNKLDNNQMSNASNKSRNGIRNKDNSLTDDKANSERIKPERENGQILEQVLSDMAWHG